MYDVSTALQEIEEELISSMRRNMSRHTAEQLKEGMSWTQWQAEMLVGLKDYEKANKKLFPDYFSTINDKIDETIRQAYASGEIEEAKMLEKVLKNHTYSRAKDGTTASFFRLNDRKLNALIAATQKDINTAEWALLRRANDIYRQTIFNTQFKYATGGKTLYQAIDECTKEFLKNGIDCVQYKNGARVNIASYSEMALRTTNKRASLMGAANKRMEYGIHTVIVSAHNTACPMCVQWQGRIYYDDVYGQLSYDEIKNPKYPLLSTAVSGGMFHPNCRNGMNTYYEGVNSEPEPPTEKQKETMLENYYLEQRQRQCERNVRKFRILENSALDQKDKIDYSLKAEQWRTRLENLVDAHPDILRFDRERLKTWGLDSSMFAKLKKSGIDCSLYNLDNMDLSNIKLKKDHHYIATDLMHSNPNHNKGGAYTVNCQRCVPTYEMRCRGFDVQALPKPKNDILCYGRYTRSMFDGADDAVIFADELGRTRKKQMERIEQKMKEYGDGARAEIRVVWRGKHSGHVFVAEQYEGKTLFIDPQTGESDVAYYFDSIAPGQTWFLRIDDLKINKTVLECVK